MVHIATRRALPLGILLALLLAGCGRVITRPTTAPTATVTATPTNAPLAATPRPTATLQPLMPSDTPTLTPTPVYYRIQPGDNLYIIANKFGVSHDALRAVNGIENERTLQVGQELFIPLAGETGPPKPTATATPTPLPVAVEHVFFHPGPFGELTVLGEARNAGASDIEHVLVRITLFDELDRPLASSTAYPALYVLAPEQRAPFVLRFAQPPARFSSYQAEVLSAAPAYLGSLHRALTAVGVTTEQRAAGRWRVQGRILNTGAEEAVEVSLVATVYDPLGRVVGMRSVAPEPAVVARGGEAAFDLEIAPVGPVAAYTLQAQGRRLLPASADGPGG